MTAPARPQPRTDRPATLAQLLVLADRAERGRLTPAEADRLRTGIHNLLGERRHETALRSVPAIRRSVRLRGLVLEARRRGHRMVPLAALEAALGPQLARQGR